MTLIEAISRADYQKPNNLTMKAKIDMISRLDSKIKSDIIDTHENADSVEFAPYDEDNTAIELLAKFPYDDIYEKYLSAQIDLANNEFERYNISSTVYNTAYNEFERAYNRAHTPLKKEFKFF